MDRKERTLKAIRLEEVDRIPTSYRGMKYVTKALMEYLGIRDTEDFGKIKSDFLEKLGSDYWGMGHNICYFSTFHAKYNGPIPDSPYIQDDCFFYALGARAIAKKVENYDYEYPRFIDPPLGRIEEASEIEGGFLLSKLKHFDFNSMDNLYYFQKEKVVRQSHGQEQDGSLSLDSLRRDKEFIALGTFNSLFMICSYLRGMDQFLMDLAANKRVASKIVGLVGEFCLEYNRRELEAFGDEADYYCCWDDVATQQGMFFSPEMFNRHFLPIYKKLIEMAKDYGLIFDWHCCGSVHDVLPAMIDAGIDIFDVVQTSAKDMDLENIYRLYGNKICIHGGMDVQDLLFQKSPKQVRKEVNKAISLWRDKGGIILAPSHECMPHTPVENIVEIYRAVDDYFK